MAIYHIFGVQSAVENCPFIAFSTEYRAIKYTFPHSYKKHFGKIFTFPKRLGASFRNAVFSLFVYLDALERILPCPA